MFIMDIPDHFPKFLHVLLVVFLRSDIISRHRITEMPHVPFDPGQGHMTLIVQIGTQMHAILLRSWYVHGDVFVSMRSICGFTDGIPIGLCALLLQVVVYQSKIRSPKSVVLHRKRVYRVGTMRIEDEDFRAVSETGKLTKLLQ